MRVREGLIETREFSGEIACLDAEKDELSKNKHVFLALSLSLSLSRV